MTTSGGVDVRTLRANIHNTVSLPWATACSNPIIPHSRLKLKDVNLLISWTGVTFREIKTLETLADPMRARDVPQSNFFHYRPQRSWGKVVFLHVSVTLFTGGLPHCMLGYTPGTRGRHPAGADPPRADTPSTGADPPSTRHPPQHRACWEMRPTSGQYASYWNTILFSCNFWGNFGQIIAFYAHLWSWSPPPLQWPGNRGSATEKKSWDDV